MKTKGIEIYMEGNGDGEIGFPEILQEIPAGESFHWSVLFMDAWRDDAGKKSCVRFLGSERGLMMSWNDLNVYTSNLFNLLEACVIGSKDEQMLRNFEDDQEMFETCDLTINNIDGWYWEVFSKDEGLIKQLASKFKRHKLMDSDFLNKV